MKNFQKLFTKVALFTFIMFAVSACELFPEEDPIETFFITSFESLSNPVISGTFKEGGNTYTNLTVPYFSITNDGITLWIEGTGGFSTYSIEVPSKNGNYEVTSSFSADKMQFYRQGANNSSTSGSGTLSDLKIDRIDETRGKVSFKVSGKTVITYTGVTTTTTTNVDFTLSVSFDNTSDPPASTGSGTGTNAGGTGGTGGTTDCKNTVIIPSMVSYYSYLSSSSQISLSGTGKKVAANAVFSDYKSTDIGLVLEAINATTKYKYQVIILIPSAQYKVQKINFKDDNDLVGLESNGGAVGILVAIDDKITDSWRTNRDFGDDKDMGDLNITSLTTANGKTTVKGTYSFDGGGDGYDGGVNNKQFAKVNGEFCITY